MERITLEQIKENHMIIDALKNKGVRIWSGEWETYWSPGGRGYTPDGLQAGVWEFEDAYKRTNHCGPEKKIEYRVV